MSASHMMHESSADEFSRETSGLPEAAAPGIIDLADGDTIHLTAAPVRKRIGDPEVRMLAYNGSVPGPTLRVRQGSTVIVEFTNETDLESTVHWHGLRLENRYDGTHATQVPVPVGSTFTYRVTFPDPGVYWYHPHIREDYGQEMGLYGNVIVEPDEAGYWSPVNHELAIVLDDVLIEGGRIAPFSRSSSNYTAMGRFGNVLLANGEPCMALAATCGEVVRLYLTNTANTRVFNVGFDGARMKLVGGDSGRVEREAFVESVVISPSERVIVEVLFDRAGQVTMEHRTPERCYTLATVELGEGATDPAHAAAFETLRTDPDLAAERERLAPFLVAEPDRTLAFVAEMDMGAPEGEGPVFYTCPMHPEIVNDQPGSCPICGMKLLPAELVRAAEGGHGHGHHEMPEHHGHAGHEMPEHHGYHEMGRDSHAMHGHEAPASHETQGHHEMHGHASHEQYQMHGHVGHESHGHHEMHGSESHDQHTMHAGHEVVDHGHHEHGGSDGIEWEDDMVAVNRMTTPDNTRWLLVDRDTGATNHAIDWRFRVGDRVKIRLVNEMDSDHPMHHPFHVHGAGRFLVLARDGEPEANLVWKDTVLVRTGQKVDLLLEVTNPGTWMAHCHIAEHHESGMMLHFTVTE